MVDGVRAPIDLQTSFLDLSQVYGPSDTLAALLRDPASGRLLTDAGDLLPKLADLQAAHGDMDATAILAANGFFGTAGAVAGDPRVNQQAGLTSGQTLLMRVHNHNADQLSALHPGWSDDRVFETARAITEAEWQHVIYDEYLPKLLGPHALAAYAGFDPSADPSIINEWTTAAFRFGHDEASNDDALTEEDGSVFKIVTLAQNFAQGLGFDPTGPAVSDANGQTMDRWLRGEMARHTQAIDGKVADGVRDTLFGLAGVDLAAIDVVRGDDHGTGSLNLVRTGLGLSAYRDFDQFARLNHVGSTVKADLVALYGNDIERLDTNVGGLLEAKHPGSMLGETFYELTARQFENTRDGDRFWYENRFRDDPDLIRAIKQTSLADLIKQATGIDYVYHDAFAAATRIGGTDASEAVRGTRSADLILGFGGSDALRGRAGDDDVWGGDGNDRLRGNAGNDRVCGEAGNDRVSGGAGNDHVSGGAGDDRLWGNAGHDVFVIEGGGTDVIRDFARNEQVDLSACSGFGSLADVRAHATNRCHDVVIDTDDGRVVIEHTSLDKLGCGNFVFSDVLDHLA